jgi:hypothetical protein
MHSNIIKTISTLLLIAISPFTLSNEPVSFGVSLGSPAGANFVIKTNKFGLPLQVSGGYWGDKAKGIELGYSFFQNESSLFSSAQFIVGHSEIEDKSSYPIIEKWTYAGISTTFSTGSFYIEPGLTFGSGDHSNPQFTIQVGWLWGI